MPESLVETKMKKNYITNWPNCGHKCKGKFTCGCEKCDYGHYQLGVGCVLPIKDRPLVCLIFDCGEY